MILTDELITLLQQAKHLAKRYRELTGRPLGIAGEIAESEAVRLLGVELAGVRMAGYDVIRRTPIGCRAAPSHTPGIISWRSHSSVSLHSSPLHSKHPDPSSESVGDFQASLREERLSSLLRASHLRSSSNKNMPIAKGIMTRQTFPPTGAVPRRAFPQGV